MIGLDTNILARFIVRDDEKQAALADAFFAEIEERNQSTYLSHLVLLELMWLLSTRYSYSKPSLCMVLETLLLHKSIIIEDDNLIHEVHDAYKNSKADFADILIGLKNTAAGCQTTMTFDRMAAKLDDFSLLS